MAASSEAHNPPQSFKFQQSSPLETLFRRTSEKRPKVPIIYTETVTTPRNGQYNAFDDQPSQPDVQDHQSLHGSQSTPPRKLGYTQYNQLSPPSPLIHSRFARNSAATSSSIDNNSYLDTSRTSIDSRSLYQELEYRYYDDDSIYSDTVPPSPAIRDSWNSSVTTDTARTARISHNHNVGLGSDTPGSLTPNANSRMDMRRSPSPSTPTSPIPTVVISTPVDGNSSEQPRAGRAPIVRSLTSNFSRPVRNQLPTDSVIGKPPLLHPHGSEEQKRKVLERNTRRTASTSPSSYNSESNPHMRTSDSRYGLDNKPHVQSFTRNHQTQLPTNRSQNHRPSSPNPQDQNFQNVPVSLQAASRSLSPSTSHFNSRSNTGSQSLNPDTALGGNASHKIIHQSPTLRAGSPVSLYSNYSYYQYESPIPSPIGDEFHFQQNGGVSSSRQQSIGSTPQIQPSSSLSPKPFAPVTEETASTPQEFLQLGIQHHEANRLKESAVYFEKSARESGGCGVGMLMWGLALRHGWGCEKDEKIGFKWLRRAAESAVGDLESARSGGGVDESALRTELVLAIYEVGQCFFHGWGVTKDQKMAVSYYSVAARLGDADAQSDLAFCLANGRGCKKDRKEAAKWYRAAVAQGQSEIGLAWIYKEKYQ